MVCSIVLSKLVNVNWPSIKLPGVSSSKLVKYGAVPPVMLIVAVPSLFPSHNSGLLTVNVATKGSGSVIWTVNVSKHPLESWTITVYVPTPNPTNVLVSKNWSRCVVIAYWYGGVPPVGLNVILPFAVPLQVAGFTV